MIWISYFSSQASTRSTVEQRSPPKSANYSDQGPHAFSASHFTLKSSIHCAVGRLNYVCLIAVYILFFFFYSVLCPTVRKRPSLQQATLLYSKPVSARLCESRQDRHVTFYGVCLIVGVYPKATHCSTTLTHRSGSLDIRGRPNPILTWQSSCPHPQF